MLGQGTFGQVVKCWDTETNKYVAVKVIKNQPAFYQQAIMEVSLLRTVHSFLVLFRLHYELRDYRYELLKRNHLRGLKVQFVQAFSKQILDAMIVMRDGGIIHCDLKPENILLAPTAKTAAAVKVIDFGSACLEGLPLFPGASEYDVLKRMLKILGGQPPDDLLREAKNTAKFFKHVGSGYLGIGAHDGPGTAYRMLSEDEVEGRETKRPKLGKWYFPQQRLDQLIYTYPWDNTKLPETEKADRVLLVDFLRGLLEFDPNKRWSPFQASGHPFITGEPFIGPYEPVSETPRIPVAHAAAVDHNPGGGHWLVAGLSPQVGSANRCLPPNNPYPPKMPFSYGSSYGSLGSHGSYAGNAGLASSYGSYGDVNNANMYYSPLGPSGFSHVSSSPDIRLRPRLSYDRGIRLSPGSMGPMSLGASPSQFTPPNYQMHTPANSTGKHGSGSPASGGIHGSPLGKAAPVGQYSRRKNMPMPPHEYTSQHGQGRHGDGVSFSHSDAYIRGHAGYSQHSLPSSGHSSWRPQITSRSGFSMEASSSHGPSQAYSSHNAPPLPSFDALPDTSAPSTLDPSDWDPNYSDESLLQEDNSLSADLSSNLHLRDATATERVNNFTQAPMGGAPVLLFHSVTVVSTLRIILSKVSGVAMDINFFNRDTTSQLTVICGHRWGVTKVGSLHGLPTAWARECPGELLAAVDSRPWKRLAKRRVQHYGYEFLYETRNVDSKQFLGELPSFVSKILEKIVTFPGVKNCTGKLVDQLTVNEYPCGVGLSPHIDTHSAFEEMIFSLSLAGPCIMEFRQYPKGSWRAPSVVSGTDEGSIQDPQCIRKAVFLPPRSMLLMSGEGRYAWHHYIPHHKIDDVAGQVIKRNSRRVSFTLRKVRMGLCECEYGQFCDSQSNALVYLQRFSSFAGFVDGFELLFCSYIVGMLQAVRLRLVVICYLDLSDSKYVSTECRVQAGVSVATSMNKNLMYTSFTGAYSHVRSQN
ncbi:unnamed protein product [Triticum aestivum]|uniref:Uncharacterized protein n=1 Tax=Triticum aestivum TaxID=4565 RepID=A0A7H4LM89_WHEAT|nr:unnamed protein product [Triticum aestivum]